MTLTSTRPVRRMYEIGAGDITAGQVWKHIVIFTPQRKDWVVTDVDREQGVVTLVRGSTSQQVSFGSLLASWQLVKEA